MVNTHPLHPPQHRTAETLQTGLFPEFTHDGRHQGLAGLDPPPRE